MVKWVGLGILCGSPSREIGAARLPSMMSGQVGRGDDGKPSREWLTAAQKPFQVGNAI